MRRRIDAALPGNDQGIISPFLPKLSVPGLRSRLQGDHVDRVSVRKGICRTALLELTILFYKGIMNRQ